MPVSPRPAVVIGSHGLFGTSDSAKQVALADACVAVGLGYFRFDHRGCGRSTGDLARVTTLSGRVQDLLTAIEVIACREDTSDIFGFFGSSFGGTVSIEVFGLRPPAAVVLCAAPVRSGDIDPSRAVPDDDSVPAPRPAGLQFDVTGKLAALQDVLIFHGDADEVVPYRHAGEIYTVAANPKELITLPGGDHRMTDPSHQELFVKETIRWFRDRLPNPGGL
ncbi:MAG: alpha/beta hydrolase [Desulfobacterales bacterium]|nr:alpha/beta hydrolase [Desulfobacterales bacterium]